jgi:hypothetical protein
MSELDRFEQYYWNSSQKFEYSRAVKVGSAEVGEILVDTLSLTTWDIPDPQAGKKPDYRIEFVDSEEGRVVVILGNAIPDALTAKWEQELTAYEDVWVSDELMQEIRTLQEKRVAKHLASGVRRRIGMVGRPLDETEENALEAIEHAFCTLFHHRRIADAQWEEQSREHQEYGEDEDRYL